MTVSKKYNQIVKKASVFTLIELLVAITILAVGLGSLFAINASATKQTVRSEKVWARQHLLTNACEFFLLFGENEPLPADLLPRGYRATCELEVYEEIPEESLPAYAFENSYKGWYLGKYTITLFGPDGTKLKSQEIEKIVRDSDEL